MIRWIWLVPLMPPLDPNPLRVVLDGYQMLVRGDVMRGKYRNSYKHPEPFVPNEVTNVKFDLPDIYHTFKKGHKIMVHIQSSWFPLVDRNPQTFVNIYKAKREDFQKSTHKLYHSKKYPSRLEFKILKNWMIINWWVVRKRFLIFLFNNYHKKYLGDLT